MMMTMTKMMQDLITIAIAIVQVQIVKRKVKMIVTQILRMKKVRARLPKRTRKSPSLMQLKLSAPCFYGTFLLMPLVTMYLSSFVNLVESKLCTL